MLANLDDIAMHLRCPKNGDALRYVNGHYRSEVGIEYPITSSQPVLVDFDRSVLDPAWVLNSDGASVLPRKASKTGALVKKYLLHGGADTVARANANRFLAEASRFSSQPLVLIIGGGKRGIGTDPIYDSPQAKVVGFDVYASPLTHFIADGHRIPVADSLFDGVWIQYVMEHVLEPWVVAAEIARVLKPNGVVYSETPFLQQVHERAYDFCRFTHSGHRPVVVQRFRRDRFGDRHGYGTSGLMDHRTLGKRYQSIWEDRESDKISPVLAAIPRPNNPRLLAIQLC